MYFYFLDILNIFLQIFFPQCSFPLDCRACCTPPLLPMCDLYIWWHPPSDTHAMCTETMEELQKPCGLTLKTEITCSTISEIYDKDTLIQKMKVILDTTQQTMFQKACMVGYYSCLHCYCQKIKNKSLVNSNLSSEITSLTSKPGINRITSVGK